MKIWTIEGQKRQPFIHQQDKGKGD